MWHPSHDPRQRAAEGIQKLPGVEESSRGYTKAPEGRRDKATFRRPSDDQDDQRPTGFDRLMFLNMFKNSSRSFFRCQTLVGLRRLRQTFPGDWPWLPASSRLFRRCAADQPKILIGYYRDQINPWWNGGISRNQKTYTITLITNTFVAESLLLVRLSRGGARPDLVA